jgi:GH18 family chitinase
MLKSNNKKLHKSLQGIQCGSDKTGNESDFRISNFFCHILQAANVIGYFTNWGIYGDQPYTAKDIPYQ